jgi:plasmid stabilization system protein ParE
MSRRVTFVSRAAVEYADAVVWYEQARRGLGAEFRLAVQGMLRLVAERPQVFAVHPATGLRRALVPRFPYVIHFEATAERVVVFAVFHAKRDPGALAGRH